MTLHATSAEELDEKNALQRR